MNIADLESYYRTLCEKVDGGKFEVVLNNDRAHNSVVERVMLEKSQIVNMYCGEMSIFRAGFYSHINNANDNSQQEEKLGDVLKTNVIEALKNFTNRPKTKLNVYFEKFEPSYLTDLIDLETFKYGIKLDKICLYELDDNLFLKKGVAHTTYTDSKIIRIERNSDTHEAVCGLNISGNILKEVESTFKTMASVGKKINILN